MARLYFGGHGFSKVNPVLFTFKPGGAVIVWTLLKINSAINSRKRKEVVIYARVSSLVQEREGFSIPAQIKLLKDYAFSNRLKIVKEFTEAETAKKAGRTQFRKLVEYIKANPNVKAVLAEKTDRLYRNMADYTELNFEDLGIEIHLVKENEVLDRNSRSHQKFIHGIKVLMAKNYCDNLSEEVKKGHAEKLALGVYPSKAPLGYQNRLEDHSIIVDQITAPLIRRTFEEAETGNYSLSKLSAKMFDLGLVSARAKKKLGKSAMKSLLSNTFYYGSFFWKEQLYEGSHEAIISKELFDEVQLKMGIVSKPRKTKYDFTFRGPMTCGHCGSQITAQIKRKPSGKQYTYYHCTNGKGTCENVSYIREEKIEEQYVKAFSQIKLTEDIVSFTKEALLQSHHQEKELREAQLKTFVARYKKLESYIDQAYQDRLDGLLETDDWKSRTSCWKIEQEDLNKKIEALRNANTAYMLEGIKLMELANSAYKLFPHMKMDEKREMISLVLSNPRIENASLRYSYNKPFNLFDNIGDLTKWRERRDSNPRPPA